MHGRSDRNSSSPPWITSKESSGWQSLVGFGYAAGSSAVEMDRSGVEIEGPLLGKARRDLQA